MKWWHNLPLLRFSPVLGIILALLITLHLFSVGFYQDSDRLYDYVGLSTDSVLKGHIWTLGSYAFFHHPEHFSHLAVNCFMLVYYGGRITHIFGSGVMIRICGAGILTGAGAYLLFVLVASSDSFLIGFSGACFALLAAHLHLSGGARFCGLKGSVLLRGLVVATCLCCLISLYLEMFSGSASPQIAGSAFTEFFLRVSHACHLGGLLAGWFIAWKMIRIFPIVKKD